jgi:hypothetical protein
MFPSGPDRIKMIEDDENDEEREADAETPSNQFLLDGQERLIFDFFEFGAKIGFGHGALLSV